MTWAPSKSRPLPKPADRNRVVENLNKLFKHLTGDVSTHSSQHLTGRRRADANLSHSSTDRMSKRSRLVAPEGSYKWLLWQTAQIKPNIKLGAVAPYFLNLLIPWLFIALRFIMHMYKRCSVQEWISDTRIHGNERVQRCHT